MIKVKVNNEYKDIVKIFCGGTLQKEIVKVWSREAQEYVYESSVEYTASLPISINANGDALIDYRIYGASGGVGVVTENLFDKNTITPNSFLRSDGTIGSTPLCSISDFIPVENGDYLVYRARSGYSGPYHCVYDENKNFVRSVSAESYINTVITIGDGEKFIRISVNSEGSFDRLNMCMVVEGTTAPTEYEPYGYKLPMTVQSVNLIDASLSEQTIEIKPSTQYNISRYDNNFNAPGLNFGVYDENDNLIWRDYLGTWHGENLRVFDNAKYFKITIPNRCLNAVSLVEGIRPPELTTKDPYPENYIPYQKITIPVYIGDNRLTEGEYVSYGEQKIYKRTENLFNINRLYSTVVVQGQTFTKPASASFFDVFSGTSSGSATIDLQKSIPVTSGTYTLSFEESETKISVIFSDGETQTIIAGSSGVTPRAFDVSSDGYISIRCENPAVCSVKKLQIVKASTAPEQYIPYVAPTDPPVPLPEIPTIDGTTIIDYDGDPKPSQMYVKYRR